jgi:rhamnose transport system permease protein
MSTAGRLVWRSIARWEALLVLLIIGAGIWSSTLSSFFLRRANLLDLQTPYIWIGLLALGLTFVVVAGEIDISVASMMAVSAVCIAEIWQAGVNVWLAGLAGLCIATTLGLVNGVLVGLLNLPSLAVTLGTLAAFRGLAYVILGGDSIAGLPTDFTNAGGGYVANEVPIALLLFLGAAVVLGVLLHATRFGRYVYTIGSNKEVARFSGVPVARAKVTIFALSGLMAGFAAIVYLGYFGSIQADAASGSELIDVVTAVVLGGVDIFGGSGTMAGVLLASILVAVLRNGMQLANLGGATQDIVIGGLLLGAILAGNAVRAARGRSLPLKGVFGSRKEVTRTESGADVPAQARLETRKGGG